MDEHTLSTALKAWTGGCLDPDLDKVPWSRLRRNITENKVDPFAFIYWYVAGLHRWSIGRLSWHNELCCENTFRRYRFGKTDLTPMRPPEEVAPLSTGLLETGRTVQSIVTGRELPAIARFDMAVTNDISLENDLETWTKGVLTMFGDRVRAGKYPGLRELLESPSEARWMRYVYPVLYPPSVEKEVSDAWD